MSDEKSKISSFTDLDAWKEGHKLVLMLYRATKHFPRDEFFGLTNQLRRAVVSITSNIAEGFGRFSHKERVQFFYLALSSLMEVQNQVLIARDVGYLSASDFNMLAEQSVLVSKILNGLIKKTKTNTHTS